MELVRKVVSSSSTRDSFVADICAAIKVGLDVSPKPPMERGSSDSSASSANNNSLKEEEKHKLGSCARMLSRRVTVRFLKSDQSDSHSELCPVEMDLATIARTSGAVTNSPPKSNNIIHRSVHSGNIANSVVCSITLDSIRI